MRGFLFVISGPSAVGKTSVAKEIFERCSSLERIITCTTRAPRAGESDGVDYFFMSREIFAERALNGEFVESSEVYGNSYGVLFSSVQEKINGGHNSVLVLNWEGFLKIKKVFPDAVCGFFIVPPSLEVLRERIQNRNSDSPDDVARRLKTAQDDMSHQEKFDYCCENREISSTADQILAIIAEKTSLTL
ncbi:MAG: guanylate kinase [Holosporaceae bacterium]|jgi:guanylate kinase|nr:guanylate kinase [Holosporaceae bacterium]